MTAVPCVGTPLRRKKQIMKAHVENIKHPSTNELERKLKKDIEWIRLLDEKEHLRNELREFLSKLEQEQALNGEKIKR